MSRQYLFFDHAPHNPFAYVKSLRCYLDSYFLGPGLIILTESWQLVIAAR